MAERRTDPPTTGAGKSRCVFGLCGRGYLSTFPGEMEHKIPGKTKSLWGFDSFSSLFLSTVSFELEGKAFLMLCAAYFPSSQVIERAH